MQLFYCDNIEGLCGVSLFILLASVVIHSNKLDGQIKYPLFYDIALCLYNSFSSWMNKQIFVHTLTK